MKKLKKRISMLIAMAVVLTTTSTVYASDLSSFKQWYNVYEIEEQRRIDEIQNSSNPLEWIGVFRENMPINVENATRSMCTNCYWFGVSVCAGDATVYAYRYHGVFLGIGQSDCLTYYYKSRGAEMCPSCQTVLWELGEHDCFEYHTICNKGRYDVCIMDVH